MVASPGSVIAPEDNVVRTPAWCCSPQLSVTYDTRMLHRAYVKALRHTERPGQSEEALVWLRSQWCVWPLLPRCMR